MWLLIRQPESAPFHLQSAAKADKPQKPQGRDTKKEEEIVVPIFDREKKESSTLPEYAGEGLVDYAIRETALKLGVPVNAVKRRKQDDVIRFSIPIDRSQMDLTYANMIFKGEMELVKASLISGKEGASSQFLSFKHRDYSELYEIALYYDSKLYKRKDTNRTITIVIDDFGNISGSLLEGFLGIDPEVCFAIFPDEPYSELTMRLAKQQERDMLVHVPMEPIGYPSVNPGKNAILVQHSESVVTKRLNSFFSKLPDAIGINNHMGSLATTDPELMGYVMKVLKANNKLFLDSRTSNVSIAYQTAQKANIKAFKNDIFLDSPNISQKNMNAKLKQIQNLSDNNRHVIAITHCHNKEKLDYLKEFIQKLKEAGYSLVPLSEIGERKIPEII